MIPIPDAFMIMQELQGGFVDAVLTDDADNLVFCSFWGHDTSIRELQGRFTLGTSEGGLTTFNLSSADRKVYVRIANVDTLEQISGRVQTGILGELVHYWLYHRNIIKPDLANHRAMLITQDDESPDVWSVIKHICPVPLLDHWKDILMPQMKDHAMIKSLQGINQWGTQIAIDEAIMTDLVKAGCRNGMLTV